MIIFYKNNKPTTANIRAIGLATALPEAAAYGGVAGIVEFRGDRVRLPLPAVEEAPAIIAICVDVGVIVRCKVSSWATAIDDVLMRLSNADTAEAGGTLKRPCDEGRLKIP